MAKLTLFSVYSYLNGHNIDLFESFSNMPEDIDKEILENEILIKGGEFGCVYADPDFIKMAVDNWTQKWLHTIERWVKAQNEDYNPLHNYDRYESYTDVLGESTHGEGSSGGTDNATNTESKNTYDSDTLHVSGQSTTGATTTLTSSSDGSTNRTSTHEAHLYGNIGVTTSAQMLAESRNVERWALYENIAGLFISEFCVPVYD